MLFSKYSTVSFTRVACHQYGIVSQLNLHGYSEEDGLIVVKSRPGEHIVHPDDILAAIRQHGETIAVVFLSGVHYYTGNTRSRFSLKIPFRFD